MKTGDKVVVLDARVLRFDSYKIGDKATIISCNTPSSARIELYDGVHQYIDLNDLILEEVYNSPLYQALRETDEI